MSVREMGAGPNSVKHTRAPTRPHTFFLKIFRNCFPFQIDTFRACDDANTLAAFEGSIICRYVGLAAGQISIHHLLCNVLTVLQVYPIKKRHTRRPSKKRGVLRFLHAMVHQTNPIPAVQIGEIIEYYEMWHNRWSAASLSHESCCREKRIYLSVVFQDYLQESK